MECYTQTDCQFEPLGDSMLSTGDELLTLLDLSSFCHLCLFLNCGGVTVSQSPFAPSSKPPPPSKNFFHQHDFRLNIWIFQVDLLCLHMYKELYFVLSLLLHICQHVHHLSINTHRRAPLREQSGCGKPWALFFGPGWAGMFYIGALVRAIGTFCCCY